MVPSTERLLRKHVSQLKIIVAEKDAIIKKLRKELAQAKQHNINEGRTWAELPANDGESNG
tara:strand:- start:2414 stop:2596 length:183 start_codon:yes stop_codon:yes gene_type:complete